MDELLNMARRLDEKGVYTTPTIEKRAFLKGWSASRNEWLDDAPAVYTGIGILTGEVSGIICLDIDILDTDSSDLLEFRKELLGMLPANTLSGRIGDREKPESLFFTYNGERKRAFMKVKVDVLSNGGQVMVPPSAHPKGYNYKWVGTPLDRVELSHLPVLNQSILDFIEKTDKAFSAKGKNESNPVGRCNHNSHNKFSNLGVKLFHEHINEKEITTKLLKQDEEFNGDADFLYFNCPTRNWKEKDAQANAELFVSEIVRNHAGKREEKPTTVFQCMSDVQRKDVEHLDGSDKILAKGMIIGISGDPGAGKSRVVRKLIAEISNGRSLSGERIEPVSSLMFNAEDHAESVIKKDFDGYGADQSRIFVVDGACVVDQKFLDRHKALILEKEIKVIIFDTITSYMRDGDDLNSLNKVKEYLGPIINFAKEHGVCAVFIRHLNKQVSSGTHIYRGMGSIGVTGSFRSEFHVVKNNENSLMRHLLHVKCNFGKNTVNCAYTFNGQGAVQIESFKHEGDIDAIYQDVTANILGDDRSIEMTTKVEKAQSAIFQILKDKEEIKSKDLEKQLKELGHTAASIRRARDKVCTSKRVTNSKGVLMEWRTSLKDDVDLFIDQGEFVSVQFEEETVDETFVNESEIKFINSIFDKTSEVETRKFQGLLKDSGLTAKRAVQLVGLCCEETLQKKENSGTLNVILKRKKPDEHTSLSTIEHVEVSDGL